MASETRQPDGEQSVRCTVCVDLIAIGDIRWGMLGERLVAFCAGCWLEHMRRPARHLFELRAGEVIRWQSRTYTLRHAPQPHDPRHCRLLVEDGADLVVEWGADVQYADQFGWYLVTPHTIGG